MKTDTEIRIEGTDALIKALGAIEAERYIALVAREKFDYTAWRRMNLPNESIEEISSKAMRYRKEIEHASR